MGGFFSQNYKSKQDEVFNKLTDPNAIKTKRDGTVLRTKEEMIKDYDESYLPWPFRPVWKLDYCWRLNYMMLKHSFVLALPATAIHFIW